MYNASLVKACATYFSILIYLLLFAFAEDSNGMSPAQINPAAAELLQQPPPPVIQGDRESKQPDGVKGEWTFQGLLAADGSISTAKLMTEEDPPFEILPVHKKSRSITYLRSPEIFDTHSYPSCPQEWRDDIPCLNVSSAQLLGRDCDSERNEALKDCVILTPADYVRQFKWPASKYQVRQANVRQVPLLRKKEWQPWVQFHGSSVMLQRGEPNFPNGTWEYIDRLSRNVPVLAFGKKVRVVLDIACGAGNVAVEFEMRGAITLSMPGGGSCDDGMQLILERGYPSIRQAFNSHHRLPYPNEAFDFIHCAACEVNWELDDGLKLLEADRLLRAGGFFVWVDPVEAGTSWNRTEDLTEKVCWKLIAQEGRAFVWEKPTNSSCYLHRPLQIPSMCDAPPPIGTSWNVPLERCIQTFPETGEAESMNWPERLEFPASRLVEASMVAGVKQVKKEVYAADLNFWKENVDIYVSVYGKRRLDAVRNVLDMNAGYAGFAAAVALRKPMLQWWVLNVVPVNMPDRLGVIFDRGLIGVYHDWCQPLQIHPRSFDLVHANALFSFEHRCRTDAIIHEIDRLLRPGGLALIRDHVTVLAHVQAVTRAFHWKTMIFDTESGPKGRSKVLSCQKTFWRPQGRTNGTKTSERSHL